MSVRTVCLVVVVFITGVFVSSTPAAIIYGGPTYDPLTKTGYQNPILPSYPGQTAGDGTAICFADQYTNGQSKGNRAFRWAASGDTVTELGGLGSNFEGITDCGAYAVNAADVTVGYAVKYSAGLNVGQRAVRWDSASTAAIELGSLGFDSSGYTDCNAAAINIAGTAVGDATKYVAGTSLGYRAVRWDASSVAATELGNLGTNKYNMTTSAAYAVNAAGTAVGFADKYVAGTDLDIAPSDGMPRALAVTELGNLGVDGSGTTYSVAYAINDTGTTIGYAEKFSNGMDLGQRAVRWDTLGVPTELGNISTEINGGAKSDAWAINSGGTAVGYGVEYVNGESAGYRAVRWDASGVAATALGNLGTDNSGDTTSYAFAINTSGTAVGYAAKYSKGIFIGDRAVAWGLDGAAVDLNTLLSTNDASHWTLIEADGISNTNWVTGIGDFDPDGAGPEAAYGRAFLIQLPEPTGLSLLVLGGAMMLRRHRQT